MYSFYLGLDLGQSADYTALSILEEPVWAPAGAADAWQAPGLGTGWLSPAVLPSFAVVQAIRARNRDEGRPPFPPLSLRHLERVALRTPYPRIVDQVVTLLARPPLLGDAVLIVDATGCGAAVVDLFRSRVERLIEVHITAGSNVTNDGPTKLRVPKRDLIAATQAALQTDRLKIARGMPEGETLRSELANFRVSIDPKTAHDSYSAWREADHDDLVLSVSMAVWFRDWWNAHLDRWEHKGFHRD